jgi:hypothetical protein
MDYNNSDKLIFVLASPAGGGYRLGRIISCFDNVFWYEAIRNGKYPWRIFSSDQVKGKDISPYHFDRRTNINMIPLLGERIERFWNNQDLSELYNVNWSKEMDAAGAGDILVSGKSLLWVLHDTPEYLLGRFPNAKIINLYDENVTDVINRYLITTALFPISIENVKLKPDYENAHAAAIKKLEVLNPKPTYRDFWAWENKGVPVFEDSMVEEYKEYISVMLTDQHTKRIVKSPKYLSVSWDSLNIDTIKEFIGASSIDANYVSLIKS